MNIDSKLREIVFSLPFNKWSEKEVGTAVSQLKQLMNKFGEELIGEDEQETNYISYLDIPLKKPELNYIAVGRNRLRSEMRERKDKLLGGEKNE